MSGVIFLVLCEVEDKGECCSHEVVDVRADELDMETSEEPTDCSETDADPEQTTRVDDEGKDVVSGVPMRAAEVEVGERELSIWMVATELEVATANVMETADEL